MKRLGAPQDIANSVVFFASELAGSVNGQVLAVENNCTNPSFFITGVTAKVAPAFTCARRAAAIGAAAPLAQMGEGLDSNNRIERTLTSSLWISLAVQSSSGEPPSELTD
jgi:hypothetical protein